MTSPLRCPDCRTWSVSPSAYWHHRSTCAAFRPEWIRRASDPAANRHPAGKVLSR